MLENLINNMKARKISKCLSGTNLVYLCNFARVRPLFGCGFSMVGLGFRRFGGFGFGLYGFRVAKDLRSRREGSMFGESYTCRWWFRPRLVPEMGVLLPLLPFVGSAGPLSIDPTP